MIFTYTSITKTRSLAASLQSPRHQKCSNLQTKHPRYYVLQAPAAGSCRRRRLCIWRWMRVQMVSSALNTRGIWSKICSIWRRYAVLSQSRVLITKDGVPLTTVCFFPPSRLQQAFACPVFNCWPTPPPAHTQSAPDDGLLNYCRYGV